MPSSAREHILAQDLSGILFKKFIQSSSYTHTRILHILSTIYNHCQVWLKPRRAFSRVLLSFYLKTKEEVHITVELDHVKGGDLTRSNFLRFLHCFFCARRCAIAFCVVPSLSPHQNVVRSALLSNVIFCTRRCSLNRNRAAAFQITFHSHKQVILNCFMSCFSSFFVVCRHIKFVIKRRLHTKTLVRNRVLLGTTKRLFLMIGNTRKQKVHYKENQL